MSRSYNYTKRCDAGALHAQLVASSFAVIGITYDSDKNQTTVILDDSETKDPTDLVNEYTYVQYIPPDYPVLYKNAQTTVTDALAQYNSAVSSYTTALTSWNAAGTTALKLTASEQQIAACASAIQAAKEAIVALVNVITVLAKEREFTD